MIENRKEYYENLNTEKERAELQEREKTRREAEKAETKRRDEEEKRRTEERSAREEKHKDKLLKMEKVKKLMEQVFISLTFSCWQYHTLCATLARHCPIFKILEYWNSSVVFQVLDDINLLLVMVTNHVTTSAGREAV